MISLYNIFIWQNSLRGELTNATIECQDHSVEKAQSFQIMLRRMAIHMQMKEVGLLPDTTYKN